jgi:quercetin dioxygenase-like cupin family protein
MTDTTPITDPPSRAFALAAGEGETFWWESQLFTIKCSEGGLGLVDCVLEAGSEPPMHIHTREAEFIYVLEGELTVYVADETLSAQPGGFVFMPRNVPHTFAVDGTERARALLMYTPHGAERLFSEHRTADYEPGVPGPEPARHDLTVLGGAIEDAGMIITGPHPRDLR